MSDKYARFTTAGQRMHYCVRVSGLYKKDFCKITNLPYTTIMSWITNKVKINEKNVDRILYIAQQVDVHVTREFLLYGTGELPYLMIELPK